MKPLKIDDYIHLYLGCITNEGKLVGITQTAYLIEKQTGEIVLRDKRESIKPVLRKLKYLNAK